ncbi:MAG: peptidoglycan-binding domain-containing protein [Christensenellales bacterium]|jgi:peptidoglycan hydrolase-like protein with peptidoglycan-binding domain
MKKFLCLALALVLAMLFPIAATAKADDVQEKTYGFVSGDKGDNVLCLQLRLRELGFYNFKVTGVFGNYTSDAVKKFQQVNGFTDDGIISSDGVAALYSNSAVRLSVSTNNPPSQAVASPGMQIDWDNVKGRLLSGSKIAIIDYYTGEELSASVTGGDTFASVKLDDPSSDTATALYGGSDWIKRPVVVVIDNQRVAASFMAYPSRRDNYTHSNLFFAGSTSQIRSLSDAEHDANILIAANAL